MEGVGKGYSIDEDVTTKRTAYLSIGSNIGEKAENCRRAVSVLNDTNHIEVKNLSKLYQTEPVDYADQSWFINAVVEIITSFDPVHLFKTLKKIEITAGREENAVRFGPRILDLDILFFDNLIVETPDLIIPHPRMHHRRFVLKPICDIKPDFVHPVMQRTVKDLLNNLTDIGQKVIEYI